MQYAGVKIFQKIIVEMRGNRTINGQFQGLTLFRL
jgi:hypothetical protein